MVSDATLHCREPPPPSMLSHGSKSETQSPDQATRIDDQVPKAPLTNTDGGVAARGLSMADTDGFGKLAVAQLGELHQAIKEQQLPVLKVLRDRPEAAAALPSCPASLRRRSRSATRPCRRLTSSGWAAGTAFARTRRPS